MGFGSLVLVPPGVTMRGSHLPHQHVSSQRCKLFLLLRLNLLSAWCSSFAWGALGSFGDQELKNLHVFSVHESEVIRLPNLESSAMQTFSNLGELLAVSEKDEAQLHKLSFPPASRVTPVLTRRTEATESTHIKGGT